MSYDVSMQSDPKDRETIWMRIGDLLVFFYDKHPLATMEGGSLEVSENLASTRGAGVAFKRWAEWARGIHGITRLPSAYKRSQQDMSENVAAEIFRKLTGFGYSCNDVERTEHILYMADRDKEKPYLSDYEQVQLAGAKSFFEGLKWTFINESNLKSNRETARKLRNKVEKISEERKKAGREAFASTCAELGKKVAPPCGHDEPGQCPLCGGAEARE